MIKFSVLLENIWNGGYEKHPLEAWSHAQPGKVKFEPFEYTSLTYNHVDDFILKVKSFVALISKHLESERDWGGAREWEKEGEKRD